MKNRCAAASRKVKRAKFAGVDHNNESSAGNPEVPAPHPSLRDLDVLVGTWRLEGSDLDGANQFNGL